MTSEVIWSNIFTGVIEVIQHHMPISHSLCRRRYYRAIALLLQLATGYLLMPSAASESI